jgi:hypothetical protein
MATDNRSLTCYLPPDIEQQLINYCNKYQIQRKVSGVDTPALSTGILEILRSFLLNPTPPLSSSESVGVSLAQFDELRSRVEQLENEMALKKVKK